MQIALSALFRRIFSLQDTPLSLLTVWHVQGEVRREGRGGVEMLLRNIHECSDEDLVVDPVVEGTVFESFVALPVPEWEGVGDGAAQELGSDVGLGVVLLLHLGVLQGQRGELAVGGEGGGVVVVRPALDLGRVGVGDHHQEVVADGPVLLAGLGQVDRHHARLLLLHAEEVRLDHGLGSRHLSGDGDLGWRPVAPVLRDGRDVDVVGGEGGQVLDGVLVGLVAHQDRDLGDPHSLGHSLGVHKLFVGIVGYLVVYWSQPWRVNGWLEHSELHGLVLKLGFIKLQQLLIYTIIEAFKITIWANLETLFYHHQQLQQQQEEESVGGV